MNLFKRARVVHNGQNRYYEVFHKKKWSLFWVYDSIYCYYEKRPGDNGNYMTKEQAEEHAIERCKSILSQQIIWEK